MKSNIYAIDGKKLKAVDLPRAFDEPVRSDIIKRASLAVRSSSYQPKGNDPEAGFQTSARYVGRRRKYHSQINSGHARLPHVLQPKGKLGSVRRVPQSRGGHRAHPPKVEKILKEKINRKEAQKATRSAIAATANKEIVLTRGHRVKDVAEFPIILEDKFESTAKTADVIKTLEALKLADELARGAVKKVRAGRGKSRGRRYKTKKSVLIVVSRPTALSQSARSIPGVNVCVARELNADVLAPGGLMGRVTVYTEAALKEIAKM